MACFFVLRRPVSPVYGISKNTIKEMKNYDAVVSIPHFAYYCLLILRDKNF